MDMLKVKIKRGVTPSKAAYGNCNDGLEIPAFNIQWALDLTNSIRSRGLVVTQVGCKSRQFFL
jgi:hypothetical protein